MLGLGFPGLTDNILSIRKDELDLRDGFIERPVLLVLVRITICRVAFLYKYISVIDFTAHNRARICKTFKESRNRFPA